MAESFYVDALKKSKINNIPMKLSPKREIIEHQKGRCYMCEKIMGNEIRNFGIVEGPDMVTGLVSKELRAICPSCYFNLGKNPVKVARKKTERQRQAEREPTREELEKMNLRDILK
jgi:hypothetical protein